MAGAALLGGIIGGAFQIGGSALSAKKNIKLAKRQMEFQRKMSNTAYQRSVRDMRKAGINPMLATRLGGASTPPGARATVDYTGVGDAVLKGAQSVASAQQVKNMKATERLTGEQILTERYRQAQSNAEAVLANQRAQSEVTGRQNTIANTRGKAIENVKAEAGIPAKELEEAMARDVFGSLHDAWQDPVTSAKEFWEYIKKSTDTPDMNWGKDRRIQYKNPLEEMKKGYKEWRRPKSSW